MHYNEHRCHIDRHFDSLRRHGTGVSLRFLYEEGKIEPVFPVTDYKNGAPSAGAPKVFFKYFYVNTATGEKSGEKMASAVLSA